MAKMPAFGSSSSPANKGRHATPAPVLCLTNDCHVFSIQAILGTDQSQLLHGFIIQDRYSQYHHLGFGTASGGNLLLLERIVAYAKKLYSRESRNSKHDKTLANPADNTILLELLYEVYDTSRKGVYINGIWYKWESIEHLFEGVDLL